MENEDFVQAFDEALTVKQTNVNLTMGLFWIRPDEFLSLDLTNRNYLGIRLPEGGLNAAFYAETIRTVREEGKSFAELSLAAWGAENDRLRRIAESKEAEYRAWGGVNYWLVGAYWDDKDPPDQTQRFVEEGIWENGNQSRITTDVFAMRVNDKIAIKAVSTQRKGLPFDGRNLTVSRMTIKAIGTIVANRNDEAVRWFRDAVVYQPKVAGYWYELGVAYQRLGDKRAAGGPAQFHQVGERAKALPHVCGKGPYIGPPRTADREGYQREVDTVDGEVVYRYLPGRPIHRDSFAGQSVEGHPVALESRVHWRHLPDNAGELAHQLKHRLSRYPLPGAVANDNAGAVAGIGLLTETHHGPVVLGDPASGYAFSFRYTATAGRLPIKDGAGKIEAEMYAQSTRMITPASAPYTRL